MINNEPPNAAPYCYGHGIAAEKSPKQVVFFWGGGSVYFLITQEEKQMEAGWGKLVCLCLSTCLFKHLHSGSRDKIFLNKI